MAFKLPGLAKGNVTMRNHSFLSGLKGALAAKKVIKMGKKSKGLGGAIKKRRKIIKRAEAAGRTKAKKKGNGNVGKYFNW
jgi:hypothetical protein